MQKDDDHMTGATALIRALEKMGIEYVFGYPGGAALPIFDALYDAKFKFILVRHEQGATHMADGYARATGKPAAVLVTSGPGSTNTLTGMYSAFMDSVPMVVLCGQVGRSAFGKDSFQEVDIFAMSMPVVKQSYSLNHPDEVAFTVQRAIEACQSGRPGPVLLDLPKDVMSAPCLFPKNFPEARSLAQKSTSSSSQTPLQTSLTRAQLSDFASHFKNAKKPLILIGQGAVIANAGPELVNFAEHMQAPVTSTLLGKGGFPERHPLCLGMLGMHGTAYANMALTDCDLVISIGSRFDDRINGDNKNFCKSARKLHIDIDPAEIGKIVTVDASLVGDARQVLQQLNKFIQENQVAPFASQDWLQQLNTLKNNYSLKFDPTGGLKSQEVLQKLNDLLAGEGIVCTDVGQHQMWAAQFLQFNQGHQWMSSGGAGTMGFGFPAALGAQLACPEKTVVAVVGDGGFQMTACELATAARYKIPVKILILDNKYLGMVRQWQEIFYEDRLSASDLSDNPDFVKMAAAFNVKSFHMDKSSQVDAVLQAAMAYHDGPCIIHAEVAKQEGVFPMVPAGQASDKMIIEPPAPNAMSIRQQHHQQPAPSAPAPMAAMEQFQIHLQALSLQNLFLRLGFVLSKKMFTMVSFSVLQESAERGVQVALQVRGPGVEIEKLIRLLRKVMHVQSVELILPKTLQEIVLPTLQKTKQTAKGQEVCH